MTIEHVQCCRKGCQKEAVYLSQIPAEELETFTCDEHMAELLSVTMVAGVKFQATPLTELAQEVTGAN